MVKTKLPRSKKIYQSHIPGVVKAQTSRIGQRLKFIQAGRSQNQWSRELGIPQQNLSRFLSGQNPHIEFLAHLGRREGVNLNWLILGRGEPHLGLEE